jgi:hypothetical protein
MTLAAGEFIRRFLIHVLPGGFPRIRYSSLIQNDYFTQIASDPRIEPQNGLD